MTFTPTFLDVNIVSELGTSISGLVGDIVGIIASNMPTILAVFGVLLVIGIVIKLIKRSAK
jgi:hypothetical protein